MPDPSSRAAAGRRMAGPPLSGTPGDGDPVPIIMVVSCARPIGAKTSMAAKATVTRIIVLFIQSSFCLLCLQVACTCLLLPRSTHSVQNRNVKVFIILMLFNKVVTWVFCRALLGRGQKDSNLRAFYGLWFSRPAHSSALPCPLATFDGIIRCLGRLSSGENVGIFGVWCR